jgi:hypothetical protein
MSDIRGTFVPGGRTTRHGRRTVTAAVAALCTLPLIAGPASAHVPNEPPTVITVIVTDGAGVTAVTTGVVSVLEKASGWRGVWVSGTMRSFGASPQPDATLEYEECTARHGCSTSTLGVVRDADYPSDEVNRALDIGVDRHYGPGQDLVSAALILHKGGTESRLVVFG